MRAIAAAASSFGVLTGVRAGGDACCLPGGQCIEAAGEECIGQGGDPRGGDCGEVQCGGACCFLDTKECMFTGLPVCDGLFGSYLGDGTDCSSCPAAMPTAITYQGQLKKGGVPLSGTVALEFALWTLANDGEMVSGPLTFPDVPVTNGHFTVSLDFGPAAFNSNARWIEVVVCESPAAGDSECSTLSPRQSVTPSPYALQTRGMYVDENQNVGFGTKSPTDRLSIVNGMNIDEFDWNDGNLTFGALKFGAYSGEGIASRRTVGENQWGLDFYTSYQRRMSIDNFGNVGIGTPVPGTRLTVEAAGYGIEHRDGIVSLATYLDGDGGWFGTVSDHSLHFYVNNGVFPSMSIDRISNVGIGTPAPLARLHVVGKAESLAGKFEGDVDVEGTLSKSAGSFKIDHPLDPENKYLSHSFVESPDMMNVYNGNAVLDERGEVWIELPTYFEALNSDFRYQLTALGRPGPELYVAEEIRANRFRIAGGSPGQRVSWQVTGVRQDAYARQNRIPIEQDKPATERGRYRSPSAFTKPGESSTRSERE